MYHFTPLTQQPDLLSLLSSTALATTSSSSADAGSASAQTNTTVCDMFSFQQTYDDALVFPSAQTQFEDPAAIAPKPQQDLPVTTPQPYYSHTNESYYYWPPTTTSTCSPEPPLSGQPSACLDSEYNNEDLLTLHLLQQQSSNMYQTATDDGSHSSNSSVKTAAVDNYDPYRRHSFDHTEQPLAVAQPVPDTFQYQHRGSLPNVYIPGMHSWNDKKRPVSSPRQQRKRRVVVSPKDTRSKSVDFKDWLPVATEEQRVDTLDDASFPEVSDADWATAQQNPGAAPRQQKLRYEGDEYTPKWVRYTGQLKEGYCDSCKPGKWLQLKNSAYWYHKQFFHGISSVSGKRFIEPLETRAGEHDGAEGLCHQCRQFVPTCNAKRKTSVLWYRHAHKCHIYDKPKSAAASKRTTAKKYIS